MKSLAMTGIYISAVGLIVLAVNTYDYSPNWLIIMAMAGIALVASGVFRPVNSRLEESVREILEKLDQ